MRVTSAGSLPGVDFRGAAKFSLEMFPRLAPLPELPARGLGSDLVGRAAALLVGVPTELSSHGWRVADRWGIDARRAAGWWRRDLDDLEEIAQGFGGTVKVAVAGPWTLAAQLGRPRGEAVLADSGARRDIAQALWAGASDLLSECRRRLPNVTWVLQVDEPLLPTVLGGGVPTASGYGRLHAIDRAEVVEHLRPFGPDAVLHCCAAGDWLTVAEQAGFQTVYLDLICPDQSMLDGVAAWLDLGRDVIAGLLDSAGLNSVPKPDDLVRSVLRLVDRLTLAPGLVDAQVTLAPSCGLAGWGRTEAADALRALVRASELAFDELSGSQG